MITFLRLGKKGNLGNQLFQIASTIGLSSKNDHSFAFPSWKYSKYFAAPLPEIEPGVDFKTLSEKEYHFHKWEIKNENYDIQGWLQSEKYFNVPLTKHYFTFKPGLVSELQNKHNKHLSKDAILISVRRGDFVNHPRYFQLDYKYYLLALIHNFPGWERRKKVFTSDDIGYCQRHFGFLQNVFFMDSLSPMEQLVIGSQFNHFIISNSTFSWWMAWLGEKQNSKIIRPKKNFRGKYSLENNDKDFFPERWVKFDHHKYHFPLQYFKLFLKGETEEFRLWIIYQFKILKKNIGKRIMRKR